MMSKLFRGSIALASLLIVLWLFFGWGHCLWYGLVAGEWPQHHGMDTARSPMATRWLG